MALERTMSNTNSNSKPRVQFEFSPEAFKRLEDMREKLNAPTKAEVLRKSLKLFEWFSNEVDQDYVIEVQDEKGNAIFRIPVKVLLS